ncbi:unnamed protein product [Linum tenue]|uniref:Pre-mRNA-processing protein 40C n=1 Tax=Linum tenue TaxID=586396 RepID=A0AAV0LC67_9ROSI|nr:unnamed protein product [Linum tenue]
MNISSSTTFSSLTSQALPLSTTPPSSSSLSDLVPGNPWANESMSFPPSSIDPVVSSIVHQSPAATAAAALSPPGTITTQQAYPGFPSFQSPPMAAAAAAPPQPGIWLQPMQQQVPGMMRPQPPFLSYALPAVMHTGHFPLTGPGNPNLNPCPFPGVLPVQSMGVNPHMVPPPATPPTASGQQFVRPEGIQTGLTPLEIESKSHSLDPEVKGNATGNETSDVWTAHKTDTGIMYYYNALSRLSTYEKSPGFKSEPERVVGQPLPVSMENLAGIHWALVTRNDGKKYYYNNITKVSSWQVPNEVIELRKKHDDVLNEHAMSAPQANVSTDTGSTRVSLSTPAINTDGRDAIALRAPTASATSSALDLIKKKLQDSGSPVTSSLAPVSSAVTTSESNGSKAVEAATAKGILSGSSKEKLKDMNEDDNMSDSSSDSEEDNGPTKEECIAIPSHSGRRSLFDYYVKTRAEEERKEKRAAQKAAVEGFKQLLEEASKDIDKYTDYQTFRKKWGNDPRFEALDRKDREHLLNERILSLRKAAREKAQAELSAVAVVFKSMLRERGDITVHSRWSRVKDSLRDDLRYTSTKHEDREALFNEYLSDLKAADKEAERGIKSKREEQVIVISSSTTLSQFLCLRERLKERERELRKRKEREELKMERVRQKVRRKEATSSFQALLVETIKDPQVYLIAMVAV